MTDAVRSGVLAHGSRVRLIHATHAAGHFLPAGTTGEVASLHRLHARVAIIVDGGRVVMRLPREALVLA